MRTACRWALIAVAAVSAALLGVSALIAVLVLDRRPALEVPGGATAEELAQVHGLLRRHDPRRYRPGALYAVRLSAADASLLTRHGARLVGGAGTMRLVDGRMAVRASLPLTRLPGGLWLNLEATLSDGVGLPHIDRLQLGHLPAPPALARWIASQGLQWAEGSTMGEPLHRMVQQVSIGPDEVRILYRWRADAPGRLLDRIVDAPQQARLRIYTEHLAQIVGDSAAPVALLDLIKPLAATAAAHSADDDDAAIENRAWIQVLGLYVTGRSLQSLLPAARDWAAPRQRPVLLDGREDLSQHFIVSAWLAAEGGASLADAAGLAKEMDDLRFGSGFSFTDVAANRAGRMFGAQAVGAPRSLQTALAQGVTTSALMPMVSDLSEYMPEREFVARYGGVGSAAYNRVLADIDARLAALALYR